MMKCHKSLSVKSLVSNMASTTADTLRTNSSARADLLPQIDCPYFGRMESLSCCIQWLRRAWPLIPQLVAAEVGLQFFEGFQVGIWVCTRDSCVRENGQLT